MKKFLLIIKSIFIILLFNSYVFAGVSTPAPSTAIDKIAISMSHSAKNNAQTIANISSATSTLLNSSQLSLLSLGPITLITVGLAQDVIKINKTTNIKFFFIIIKGAFCCQVP